MGFNKILTTAILYFYLYSTYVITVKEEKINLPTENDPQEEILKLSNQAILYLNETRKWSMFLAILGFITVGLVVIMAFAIGAIFSALPGGESLDMMPGGSTFFMIVYLLVAVVFFFPTWYLFKFSKHPKSALSSKGTDMLEFALKNQKSLFKFMGILTIIGLSVYVIFFIIFIVVRAMI